MKVRRIVSSWLTLVALALLLLGVAIASQQAAAHPSTGAGVAQMISQQSFAPVATATNTPPPSPTATDCANSFVDISGDPFYVAIHFLYCMGAVDGVDSTHFNPNALASRAFASKAIVVAANLVLYTPTSGQDFTDVSPSSPYFAYIETGYHAGVFDSYDPTTCNAHGAIFPCFLPNQDIIVVELETYIQRAGGSIPVTPGGNSTIQRDEMCQVVYNAFFNQPPPTPTVTNTPGSLTDTPTATFTPGGPTDTPTATITLGGPTDTPTVTVTPGGPTDTPTITATPSGPTNTPTVTPTDCPNPFVDIAGNIFYTAIHYLNCRNVVNGLDATHYSPAGTSTRGQFAKVVVLAFNTPLYTPTTPDFVDVPPSYFGYLYIESGFHAGVLSGFDPATCASHGLGNPCYLPNIPMTRGQLTKLVVNAAGYALVTPTGGGSDFADVPPTNVFYLSIETCYAKGIISGYPGHLFLPNQNIRRDQMAQIIYEALQHPGPQR